MSTQREDRGVFTTKLASGDFALAVAIVDSVTGAVSSPSQAPTTTLTDKSVTITLGGTAQTAIAANTARHYLFIQNPSGSGGTLWVSFLTTAVQASPSIEILPGASYENPPHMAPGGAISVIHPTTNAKITILEG